MGLGKTPTELVAHQGKEVLNDLFEFPVVEPLPFRLSSGKVLATTPVFELYWRFAVERQQIFFKRVRGTPSPWTDDPILRTYRFTNAYRAADRVSQFLIRNVIYAGSQDLEEIFFRVLLFKLFNRIETWELLQEELEPLSWRTFDFRRYDTILNAAMDAGETIYSAAYIMPCPVFGSRRKHSNHLLLLKRMMQEKVPNRVGSAKTLEAMFSTLRAQPSLGDFLAFQFAIDLNYSAIKDFSEMDFVVAGPGARSGIRKAFLDIGDLREEEIIREVTEAADREFSHRNLEFRSLWGRPLQLVDCQNLFCEIDKYSRVALPAIGGSGRKRIKRKYSKPGEVYPQWYPPKWKLTVG